MFGTSWRCTQLACAHRPPLMPRRQLYAGMAELISLAPGAAPEDRLLLTQFNMSTGDCAVYHDLKVNFSFSGKK